MLLDTSGLLSLSDKTDTFHGESARLYQDARRRVTHDYVLAEFIPLAQVRGVPRRGVLDYVSDLLHDASVEIYWLDEQAYRSALTFLWIIPDKSYSLCDAASFLLMRKLGITEALTTDRHFEQEGLVRLLKR